MYLYYCYDYEKCVVIDLNEELSQGEHSYYLGSLFAPDGNQPPEKPEIEKLLGESLASGAIGLKILGGHYPLTPEATAQIIETAHRENAYLAFHAGTLNTESDIDGFHEALELTRDTPIHLAHINSYCRGTVRPSMAEAEEAIEALKRHPHVCSESYLSPMNGTSAKCVKGIPESQVTIRCLAAGDYPETEKGLEAAIIAGWAQINMESGGRIVLASGSLAASRQTSSQRYARRAGLPP